MAQQLGQAELAAAAEGVHQRGGGLAEEGDADQHRPPHAHAPGAQRRDQRQGRRVRPGLRLLPRRPHPFQHGGDRAAGALEALAFPGRAQQQRGAARVDRAHAGQVHMPHPLGLAGQAVPERGHRGRGQIPRDPQRFALCLEGGRSVIRPACHQPSLGDRAVAIVAAAASPVSQAPPTVPARWGWQCSPARSRRPSARGTDRAARAPAAPGRA